MLLFYSNHQKSWQKLGGTKRAWPRCRPWRASARLRPPPCPARFVLPSFFVMNSEACYKNRVQASLHGTGFGFSSHWPHKKSGHAWACPDFTVPADRRGHSNHPCTHFDTSIIAGPRKKPVINVVSPTVEPSRNPADSMEISQIIRTAR